MLEQYFKKTLKFANNPKILLYLAKRKYNLLAGIKQRNAQLKLISLSISLEEAKTPLIVRATITTLVIFFVVFIFWASVSKVRETVKITGQIIPTGNVQNIQHMDGGIIEAINVKEGDEVYEGEVLLKLQSSDLLVEFNRINQKLVSLKLQSERLRSLRDNQTPNFAPITKSTRLINDEHEVWEWMKKAFNQEKGVIASQHSQQKKELNQLKAKKLQSLSEYKISKEQFDLHEELFKNQLTEKTKYLTAKRDKLKQWGNYTDIKDEIAKSAHTIDELLKKITLFESKYRDNIQQNLLKTQKEIADTEQVKIKIQNQLGRLTITSPVDGIVQGIQINTINSAISAGKTILSIFPTDETLVAEAKVTPADIAFIRPGMNVVVKISSYDFSRFGAIEGILDSISPTTFVNKDGSTYYKSFISLRKKYVGDKNNKILSGMLIDGQIIAGEKSILAYLLKPIHLALNSGFSER